MKDGTTAVHAAAESGHEGMYGPKEGGLVNVYTCLYFGVYSQYLYER